MSFIKPPQLTKILNFSHRIYQEKEEFKRDSNIIKVLKRGLTIIGLEIILFFISLPAYLFIRRDTLTKGLRKYPEEIIRFRLRRGFAFGILGLLIITPVVTNLDDISKLFLKDSAEDQSYSWTFASKENESLYKYDPERIQIIDGVVILKPLKNPEAITEKKTNPALLLDQTPVESPSVSPDIFSTSSVDNGGEEAAPPTTSPEIPSAPDSALPNPEDKKNNEVHNTLPAGDTKNDSEKLSKGVSTFSPVSFLPYLATPAYAQSELRKRTWECSATLVPVEPVKISGVKKITGITETADYDGKSGAILYQLSFDGGSSWLFWNGKEWEKTDSEDLANFNSLQEITEYISEAPISSDMTVLFKAFLVSDCVSPVKLTGVTVSYRLTGGRDEDECLDQTLTLTAEGARFELPERYKDAMVYNDKGVYGLNKDIYFCAGKGIQLESGVTLNGNYHTVYGNDKDEGQGVLVSNAENTVVRKLGIRGFYFNYQTRNAKNALLEDSFLSGALFSSVELDGGESEKVVIRRSALRDNVSTLHKGGYAVHGTARGLELYHNNLINNVRGHVSLAKEEEGKYDDGCAGNYFDSENGVVGEKKLWLTSPWPTLSDEQKKCIDEKNSSRLFRVTLPSNLSSGAVVNTLGEASNLTDRLAMVSNDNGPIAQFEITDDLDLSSAILGSQGAITWVHFGSANRSVIQSFKMIVPKSGDDTYVRICPGAQQADDVFDGCSGEIRLSPDIPAANGYRLIDVEDPQYWYVQGDPLTFSTGGQGASDRLISRWKMDEATGCTAFDSVSTNNGSLLPTCSTNIPVWSVGQAGTSLRFDGVDDYVQVAHNASLMPSRFSVSAWININALPAGAANNLGIVSKGTTANGYHLFLNANTGGNAQKIAFALGSNTIYSLVVPTTSTWLHVVATYQAPTTSLYINGVLQSTGSSALVNNTSVVYLGRRAGTGNYFNGRIDDVNFYNFALSPAEISSLYQGYLSNPNTVSSSTLVITPLDDTYVNSAQNTFNFGASPNLVISSTRRPLLRFPTTSIPFAQGAEVTSARLSLHSLSTLTTSTISVHEILTGNAGWIEGTKNGAAGGVGEPSWNFRNTGAATAWAGSAGLNTANTDYRSTAESSMARNYVNGNRYEWTLRPALVQQWNTANHGVVLRTTATGLYQFASKEDPNTTRWPQLLVDYVIPGPTCQIVYSDNFNDNNVSDWISTWDAGVGWVALGGIFQHSGGTYSQIQSGATSTLTNYVYTATMKVVTPGKQGLLFRHTNDNNFWKLSFEGGRVKFTGRVGGVDTDALAMNTVYFTPTVGSTYNLKLQANGSALRAKWWLTTDPEPSMWQLFATDNRLLSGTIGLVDQGAVQYDNTTVSTCLENQSIPPTLELLRPNGGEVLTSGSQASIMWNTFSTSGNVALQYSKDNFISDINTITASTADTGTYTWTVPFDLSTTVRVRVRDVTSSTVFDVSDGVFSISSSSSVPISAWPFDEPSGCLALDAYGTNTGTLGPSCPGDSPARITGQINRALSLNGTTHYVSVPHASSLHMPNTMSLTAWVKPSALTVGNRIITKGGSFELGQGVSAGTLRFTLVDAQLGTFALETTSTVFSTTSWKFVAATYDGSVMKLYVNGALVGSAAHSLYIATTTANVVIGAGAGPANFWQGNLDEIGLWNRPLTAAEINNLYLTGSSQPPSLSITSGTQSVTTGRVTLNYLLSDAESDVINLVTYEYSTTSAFAGEQQVMTFAGADPAHQGITTLSSSPSGTAHSLVWDAEADLGIGYTGAVYLRLRPFDGINNGAYVTTSLSIGGYWQVDKVAPSGGDHACTSFVRRCSTIQSAVSAASATEKIRVLSGAYAESVTVPKSLTFIGIGNPTATSFTLTNGALVSSSTGISAPLVYVNQVGASGAKIMDAHLLVSPGGIIDLGAGNYAEEVTITKPLTLRGPHAGLDAADLSRGSGEAAIVPQANNPSGGVGITIGVNNVTIDGVKIDGDNPGISGGVAMNGGDSNAAYGVYADSVSAIEIKNTIFKSFTTFGVLLVNANGTINTLTHNLFDNFPANTTFSSPRVVALLNNSYTNVTYNTFRRVSVGVYMQNFSNSGPTSTISNNTISSYRAGIWHNLQSFGATALTISNNILSSEPSSVNNYALWIMSLQGAVGVTISNNIVSSSYAGYVVWNNPTSNTVTIQGGNIKNTTYGIWATNYVSPSFAGAATSTYSVQGVTITNSASSAIFVDKNVLYNGGVTLQANNNILFNNTRGFVTNGATLLNALNNWWGSASGPLDTKTLPNTPNYNNPLGTGDSVSAYIDYGPFSTVGPHTITSTASSGGSISPSGVVAVNTGATQNFSIVPNAGFAIQDVVIDGSSVGATSTYTFTAVASNHTISASFSAVPVMSTSTPLSGGEGGATVTIGGWSAPYSPVSVFSSIPSVTTTQHESIFLLPNPLSTMPSPFYEQTFESSSRPSGRELTNRVISSRPSLSNNSSRPIALPPLKSTSTIEQKRILVPSQPQSEASISSLIRAPEIITISQSRLFDTITFSGTALPYSEVIVYVHSDQAVQYRTSSNSQGQWLVEHTQRNVRLAPGRHEVYAVSLDHSSNKKSYPGTVKDFMIAPHKLAVILEYFDQPSLFIVVVIMESALLILVYLRYRSMRTKRVQRFKKY